MKKKALVILAGILAVLLLLIFALPHSLYRSAWPYRDEPGFEMVSYTDLERCISVDLTDAQRVELISLMKEQKARFAGFGIRRDAGNCQIVMNDGPVAEGYRYYSFIGIDDEAYVQAAYGRRMRNYRMKEADAQIVRDFCRALTDPAGETPGLAFLEEFFTVGKDGRWEVWMQAMFSSYSGAVEEAIPIYHSGVAPYMTEQALLDLELSRTLSNLDMLCKAKADDWHLGLIWIHPASERGFYAYEVGISYEKDGSTQFATLDGSYAVNGNGQIDSFYVDLSSLQE